MRPSPTFNSIIDAVLAASGFWVRTDGRCKIDVIFAEGSPLWGGWWQENQCVFFDIYCILLYYPIFWGDMISHCKDPYEPISINGTAVLLVFQVVCWTWTCQVKKIHVIPYEGMMMFFLHRWSHLFIRYRCNYIYIYIHKCVLYIYTLCIFIIYTLCNQLYFSFRLWQVLHVLLQYPDGGPLFLEATLRSDAFLGTTAIV